MSGPLRDTVTELPVALHVAAESPFESDEYIRCGEAAIVTRAEPSGSSESRIVLIAYHDPTPIRTITSTRQPPSHFSIH